MTQKDGDRFVKERILDKAEELFSQKGFYAVSVRQITTAANCNLAAVNYHFGNKEKLYLEVFRSRWVPRARRIHECFKQNLAEKDSPSLKELVYALAEAYIDGPLSDEARERHHQLMARELAKPTGALEVVIGEVQQPFFKELGNLLSDYLPEKNDEVSLSLKILSIFAIVHYFNFAREGVAHVTGCEYGQDFKNRLVEHIVEFCTAGLGITKQEAGN